MTCIKVVGKKQRIGLLVSILLLLCGFAGSVMSAESKKDTGGSAVFSYGFGTYSSYTIDTGRTLDDWSVQPWVRASFGPCYSGAWANVGLEHGRVDEVDLFAGCVWKNEHVSVDLQYGHYFFPPSSTNLFAPKLTACWLDFAVCAKVLHLSPNDQSPAGWQTGLWKDSSWSLWSHPFDTRFGITYTEGVYGMQPTLVLQPRLAVPLTGFQFLMDANTRVTLSGSFPLLSTGQGNDKFVGILGFEMHW